MKDILRRHHISFKAAFAGLQWAVSTQPNFRIHLVISVLAVTGGILFRITRLEMVMIILTIVLGLGAEMINTAIESVTDLVTTEWKKEAKVAKDVAAGMMLVTAGGAVVVALLIFWPYILAR